MCVSGRIRRKAQVGWSYLIQLRCRQPEAQRFDFFAIRFELPRGVVKKPSPARITHWPAFSELLLPLLLRGMGDWEGRYPLGNRLQNSRALTRQEISRNSVAPKKVKRDLEGFGAGSSDRPSWRSNYAASIALSTKSTDIRIGIEKSISSNRV